MPERMTSGALRHVASLEVYSPTTVDLHGQPSGSWAAVASLRVGITPLSGRMAEYAHQLYEYATHSVICRYNSNVISAARLKVGTRVFNIGHVENIEELNRWMRLSCSENVST